MSNNYSIKLVSTGFDFLVEIEHVLGRDMRTRNIKKVNDFRLNPLKRNCHMVHRVISVGDDSPRAVSLHGNSSSRMQDQDFLCHKSFFSL